MVGMSMSMRPSLTPSHRQEQRQSMTQSQRQAIKAQQTGLQIQLVATLRDERYTPNGECPKCHRKLGANEILAGFNNDVNDFTTECTGCHRRFEPQLICFDQHGASRIEIPFYCDVQARNRLQQVAHLPPNEIARQYPGEYRSAAIHYGTLAAMYLTMDVSYDHTEIAAWEAKVQPFLGRMPDTVIEKCLGVKEGTVGRLRRKRNISKFTKQKALEEAES